MEKEDKSIIWTSTPQKEDIQSSEETNETILKEDLVEEADITVLTMPKKTKKAHTNSFKKIWLKPVLIATLSAVLLGFFIGGVTLKVFGVMNQDGPGPASTVSSNKTLAVKDIADVQPNLDVYMLQGGVFSKQKNANDWLQKYKEKQIPAYLWERDGTYHLFAGMTLTKEAAKKDLKVSDFQNVDLFVKEWTIKKSDLNLNKEQKEWLHAFLIQWNESVKSLSGKDDIQLSKWKKLHKTIPEKEAVFSAYSKHIETFLKNVPNETTQEQTISLIKLMAIYESTFQ